MTSDLNVKQTPQDKNQARQHQEHDGAEASVLEWPEHCSVVEASHNAQSSATDAASPRGMPHIRKLIVPTRIDANIRFNQGRLSLPPAGRWCDCADSRRLSSSCFRQSHPGWRRRLREQHCLLGFQRLVGLDNRVQLELLLAQLSAETVLLPPVGDMLSPESTNKDRQHGQRTKQSH